MTRFTARLAAPLALVIALAGTQSGCTLAGGFIGGEIAYSGNRELREKGDGTTEPASVGAHVAGGAALGLVVDLVLLSLVTSATSKSDSCFVGCGGY